MTGKLNTHPVTELSNELKKQILSKAAVYEKLAKTKNKKKYINKALED